MMSRLVLAPPAAVHFPMPRAIWKGSVSFGLVTIPVSLYPSGDSAEEIGFRQLHRTDLAPIQYRRVCSAEGAEVPWGEIAKGYEYAKGQFVVITDEDLATARVEATQASDVRDFVPDSWFTAAQTDDPEGGTRTVGCWWKQVASSMI